MTDYLYCCRYRFETEPWRYSSLMGYHHALDFVRRFRAVHNYRWQIVLCRSSISDYAF